MPRKIMLMAEPAEYAAVFPCAARVGNDDLLMVFSRRPFAFPEDMRSWICGIRSTDNGCTWTPPFTLIDTPDLPDWDPNIVAWDNRVLVISTAVPKTHNVQVTASTFPAVRSEDYGQTWFESPAVPHPGPFCSGKINRGVRFPDGALAFGYSMDRRIKEGKTVLEDGDTWGSCGLMVSRDDGHTWNPGTLVDIQEERPSGLIHAINGLDEPALALCRDGSIYMLMRTGLDRLYEARSADQGQTWSAAVPTPLVAHNCPADLCVFEHPRLGRGWLAAYDHSPHDRTPLAAAVSLDEGRSWSQPLTIAREGVNPSYPTCVQTASGDILLAWHERPLPADTNEHRPYYDLRACLLGLDEIENLAAGREQAHDRSGMKPTCRDK